MNVNSPYGIMAASDDILHLDEDRWRKLVVTTSGLDVIQSGGPVSREEQQPRAERSGCCSISSARSIVGLSWISAE
ncbi:MAG: hypothetical protein JWP63_4309 [Candidatus Solibacter sp.]|nr:hypothetical protein [Candidatus Solibacter sp.]